MTLKEHEDTAKFQEDFNSAYEWAERNNMKLNGNKFQHLRCGKNFEAETKYKAPEGSEIEKHQSTRDLWVLGSWSSSGSFAAGNQMADWILRIFQTRDENATNSINK